MASNSKRIQTGQVFKERETGRDVVVTGFGISQGDETTVQVSGIDEERWGGEFSAPIFHNRFTGPLAIQTG